MTYEQFVVWTYLVILLLLAVYGFHRTLLVYLYYRYRRNLPVPAGKLDRTPVVTVQLPLYNEMYVAPRLIEAVAKIRYPKDRLEIQVLDDSCDETVQVCREKVKELQARGFDAKHIRRETRDGYKAGALAYGLARARGEFLLVFDADFIPDADILERTLDHFSDSEVGMVQVRWGHLNRDYSLLTEAQALMLDGHFVIEHTARHRSGRFFNFNGTAGVWRRKAIETAGGWQHDTLTEDLDLSYRAQMRGWKFVYLPNVVSPAEVPAEMNSFKAQQYRWAKGSIQTACKLLPMLFRAKLPWRVKAEAFFHLTNNFAYPLLLLLSILLLPNLLLRTEHGVREVLLIDLPLFLGTTVSLATFYLTSQREIEPGTWKRALPRLPIVLSLGIGLCVNQTRAVIEALLGGESEFVRTPKHGIVSRVEAWSKKRYRAARSAMPLVEILLASYFAAAFVLAASSQHYLSLPFIALFLVGYAYVGLLSLHQSR